MVRPMIGMETTSGRTLSGSSHLAQSIADILGTPLGTRVMRRDYGSLLFELIDRPLNGAVRALIHAATALALHQWEPRLKLTRVLLSLGGADGTLDITIEGQRLDLPAPSARVALTIPIRRSGATAQ